jgi:hypothetical protein
MEKGIRTPAGKTFVQCILCTSCSLPSYSRFFAVHSTPYYITGNTFQELICICVYIDRDFAIKMSLRHK